MNENGKPKQKAEKKVDGLCLEVLKSIEGKEPPRMKVPSRSTSNVSFDEEEGIYTLAGNETTRSAANARQVEKFAETMCIVDFCKDLLKSGSTATLRELYYTSEGWPTGGFKSQDRSDKVVEDLESALGVKRESLNLLPEEDGASIYGDLVVREDDSEIKATEAGRAGYTIPPTSDDVEIVECGAERVLAIETAGMYHRLVQEDAWEKYNALIVALKGQPARATRRFLNQISRELDIPVHLFTDGDPWGFHIATVVISGSAQLAHVNYELATPEANFLGVTATDIEEYSLPSERLTKKDRKRIGDLKGDPRYSSDFWQKELDKMLELGKKAEQQAFTKYGLSYVVEEYLPEKLDL